MKDSSVQDLDELHRKAKSARSRLEGTWFLNLAYFLGQQWLAWESGKLYRPQLAPTRITLVDNRIQPAVRTEIAKMTKSRPVFVVTPRSGDQDDANAAELGEQLMRYLWEHLHMQELSMKGLHWSRICGAGFLKAFWDPSVGDSVDVLLGPDGKVLADGQGAPVRADSPEAQIALQAGAGQVKRKKVAQGDVKVEVRSPFQMFIDPLADTFVEAEWVIEETVKSQEYVKQRYGKDIEPDTPANPGLIEARMSSSVTQGTGAYKGVKIREYWCKPNSQHPGGRRAVWANNKLLEEDGKPFDPMPYVMLSGIPVPGRMWPTSIVEQLRGPQTELNKVKSQIAENRNRIGNPTILMSRQAVGNAERFEDSMTRPGGVVYFDDTSGPNAAPKFLEAPQLPPYVVDEIARIEESIQEISGQHEVTSAHVPPGVTAASAINLLQEADDTRLGPAVTDYEYQLGQLGEKVLKLAAKFYTDPRTISLAGDNSAWQIFDFKGEMLRGNTSVEVQSGSAFPQSKAAKQAAMQDLLTFFVQSGNPPHGRQLAQFLKDWEMGGADRLIEDYTTDETQVNRENAKLSQGMPLPINDFDNDQAHIDAHTAFQKQQRYEQLPPQVQAVFEQHVQAHRARVAQQQQAQMQLQMQMQGTPPPEQQQAQAAQQQQGDQMQQQMQMLQGQHDLAQQRQQLDLKGLEGAQQQGLSQAQSDQQIRHAEDSHQQQMRHEAEQHQLKLELMRKQQQQQRQGANRGNRAA